jgi:hypothetical protein
MKNEALKRNWFKALWRPALGWVCVAGFTFNFIARPLINYVLLIWFSEVEIMDSLDGAQLLALTTALLGLGTLRTVEKDKGITE